MIFKILFVIVLFLYALYKYSSRNYNYWQNRNVPYIKPTPFFGNFYETFTFKKTIGETFSLLHNKFDTPYLGVYVLDKPFLIVKDPELIKLILVKDFKYFPDRYVLSSEKNDSMAAYMLFVAKSPQWKYMRTKMTPVFSSGKMKNMFNLIKEMGQDMTSYLNQHITQNFIEIKEICGKYSTNVITTCAFGLNAQSFQNHDAPFRKVARMMFDSSWKNMFNQGSYFLAHGLVKTFRLPVFDPKCTSFLREVFWKTIEERERTKEVRHDVIDAIREFQKQPHLNSSFKFEGDKVVAQATQFFAAGFETVSSAMAFALYELSMHPEIQKRLRAEINQKIAEYKGITYEAVQNMNYLDMVVKETLRKYPVMPFIDRVCAEDYQVPNSDLVISKNTPVYISLLGLHYDPKYFPNPEKFNPERFAKENEHTITPFTYLPFGEGPRACLGIRFGNISAKVGLVHIISNFEIEACADTPKLINFSSKSVFLSSIVGIPVRLKKIEIKNQTSLFA